MILLVAALLRFGALTQVPPGIEHDEVAEVLIAEGIWEGRHALFFSEAYGQEPMFLYLLAGALRLFGANAMAIRFVSASVGFLTVALVGALGSRLFNRRVGTVALAATAMALWPVFWSRVALRGMTLPLVMCIAAHLTLTSLRRAGGSRPWVPVALASGLAWGATAYTYTASRAVPLLLAASAIVLVIWRRPLLRRAWGVLLVAGIAGALVAAPLAGYLLGNKSAQVRVYEVNAPLQALRQGDAGPIVMNVVRALGMVVSRGDASERNNASSRPVFVEPVTVFSYLVGIGVVLWRVRRVHATIVLLWLLTMLTPTIATADAPNFVRALGALPAIMILVGIGADQLCDWLERRWAVPHRVLAGVLIGSSLLNVGLTVRDYFVRWPQTAETRFVWQTDLDELAGWLDDEDGLSSVTVGGLSNRTMDDPSLRLLLRRKDLSVRWCDPGSPLGSGGGVVISDEGGPILVPSIVPVSQPLLDYLSLHAGVEAASHGGFTSYDLGAMADAERIVPFQPNLGLVSLEVPERPWLSGDDVTLVSVWRVRGRVSSDLAIFVHLVDAAGAVRAQHDGLDSAPAFWREGDWVIQTHHLDLSQGVEAGVYSVRIGLYDPELMTSFQLSDGRDYLEVGGIDIALP